MKRWLMLVVVIFITACSTQPTATPVINSEPTSSIATVVPIPTLLPTVTGEAIPAVTAVLQPTVTIQPTFTPGAASTIKPAARFPAPVLISPQTTALFKDGNDIQFTFASVGRLEPNQCYLLHIELVVPNLPQGNRGDDFLDPAQCGEQGPVGKELTFVLYRGKFTNSPNYGTILAQTHELAPDARLLKMTWRVRVVQNNGRADDGVHYKTVALSPDSPVIEFDFQP